MHSRAPNDKSAEPRSKQAEDPQDQLAELKTELAKYKDVALRSVADLDNYRKRMAREKDDAIRYANANFLERLIPILDNFELGIQAAKAGGSQSAVQDGMMMVLKQLQDFLASCGVETVDATGQHFDPNVHEAIAQEQNAEIAEGFVIRHRASTLHVLVLTPRSAELHERLPPRMAPDTSKTVLSPMPGLVVTLDVTVGQQVRTGEAVAVIEAMKMQNIIRAERDGVIKTVGVKPGDSVAADEVLVEFG